MLVAVIHFGCTGVCRCRYLTQFSAALSLCSVAEFFGSCICKAVARLNTAESGLQHLRGIICRAAKVPFFMMRPQLWTFTAVMVWGDTVIFLSVLSDYLLHGLLKKKGCVKPSGGNCGSNCQTLRREGFVALLRGWDIDTSFLSPPLFLLSLKSALVLFFHASCLQSLPLHYSSEHLTFG